MRRTVTALLMLGASVSVLQAQEFTIHMKMGDGAGGTTYYVSPNAIRRTTPGANDVIDRIDRGSIIYIDHRTRSTKRYQPGRRAKKSSAASQIWTRRREPCCTKMGATWHDR